MPVSHSHKYLGFFAPRSSSCPAHFPFASARLLTHMSSTSRSSTSMWTEMALEKVTRLLIATSNMYALVQLDISAASECSDPLLEILWAWDLTPHCQSCSFAGPLPLSFKAEACLQVHQQPLAEITSTTMAHLSPSGQLSSLSPILASHRSADMGTRYTSVQITALELTSCVILRKLLTVCQHQVARFSYWALGFSWTETRSYRFVFYFRY